MIGLVVVSHSRALAEAAVGLASEMVEAADRPQIAVAAGLDETTFGTDASAVAEAISSLDAPDGVLVLLDLGSAVLSAEMALEFLEPEVAERVVVSSAPIVEGLVAAVVLASTGAPIEAVADEARRGLEAKQDHLDAGSSTATGEQVSPAVTADVVATDAGTDAQPDPSAEVQPGGTETQPDASADIHVSNAHGLHARPAARLVGLVRSFDAAVTLTNLDTGRGPVDAASLSKVATLNARHGDRLRVEAIGPAAQDAVDSVRALAERAFDDDGERPVTSAGGANRSASAAGVEEGTGADASPRDISAPADVGTDPDTRSAGPDARRSGSGLDIAMGPAVVAEVDLDTSGYERGSTDEEIARCREALSVASASIERIRDSVRASVGTGEAEIFDAQLAMLSDPSLTEAVELAIRAGASAPEACTRCLQDLAHEFESLDDAYQRERAQDVRSVLRRQVGALLGRPDVEASTQGGAGILVVPELDAATAAVLDPTAILGVVTRAGGATGHGVIVAKSRGVPVFTDAGDVVRDVAPGTVLAFDASSRRLVVNPEEPEQREFAAAIEGRSQERTAALAHADEPASTLDGCRIVVAANVTSVDDALEAVRQGAEGSGLVRTEILFGHDSSRPTVEQQTEAFLAVAAALGGQPMTIRTWDVGGDKPLRFLPQAVEANPFLGERGLRLFRRQPDVLREQLQAVCLAARETPTKVMFPMVTTTEEVGWALEQLRLAAATATGGVPSGLEVGIMIEVPAAALRAGRLTDRLDFVSIGTNDLTSYTTAAERGNAAVSALADSLEPAVLQLIGHVCDSVADRVNVAVCGDLASNSAVAALLVGLGVRELSAVAPAVPSVKAAIRRIDLTAARHLATGSVAATSADHVRSLLAADA